MFARWQHHAQQCLRTLIASSCCHVLLRKEGLHVVACTDAQTLTIPLPIFPQIFPGLVTLHYAGCQNQTLSVVAELYKLNVQFLSLKVHMRAVCLLAGVVSRRPDVCSEDEQLWKLAQALLCNFD